MPTTDAHTTVIHYDVFGPASDHTLLLINGLGSQLINWDPAFCRRFVDRGVQVVVFDNRDVGLSAKTPGPVPDVRAVTAAFRDGRAGDVAPYSLSDMAGDAIAVLDAVGVDRAHVAGMSMGGMIAQRLAITWPDRVRSLTSIMSTTGAPGVGRGSAEAVATLSAPTPSDRAGFIRHEVETRQATAGDHFDADYWADHAGRIYDRCFHPDGWAFQMAAVVADGDRTADLAAVDVATLVIHGRLDPLIGLSGGEATAAAVPGAQLLVIDSMGHDLPEPIWDDVVAAIVDQIIG